MGVRMLMATQVVLVLATLLCTLVAGFLFAFAVVAMPGLRSLGDRDFLRAFQAMDGIIQRGQPLFGLVWVGSIAAIVAGLTLGLGQLEGLDRLLLTLATAVYLIGAQAPTFLVNIPLNNQVQALDIDKADDATVHELRERFEPRWNRWNEIRATFATVTAALLLVVLIRF